MKRLVETIVKNKKTEILILILFLSVGIFIRAYHFGIIPVGIHQDEAMAAVDAKALADYGTDRYGMKYPVHFTAWGGSQMSVLLSYCMIPFIKWLGFSTVSIRLPMLVISGISLLVLYFSAKQVGGIKLGTVVLILGIICPWHYMQSRWSFDCNTFPHVFLIGVFLLLLGIKKRGWLYLSMVFFGLCSYCYGIANYSVPLFLVVMAVYLIYVKKIRITEILSCIGIYLLISLPEYLSMLLTVLKLESIETPFFTIPSFQNSFRARDILLTSFSWEQLWKNLICTITTVFGNGDKSVTNTIAKFGPVYYITIFFFIVGLICVIRKCRKVTGVDVKIPYLIVLIWFLMGIWVGIVTKEVTINRINIIFYPLLFIAGVGIVECVDKCKYLIIPIGGIYATLAIMFAANYFGSWAEISRTYYYEPYINALEYAETFPCEIYYITPDPQGEGVSAVGEILTLYCHDIDARYYQGNANIQNGTEVLPFTEKYRFQEITQEIVDSNAGKSVVYMITGDAISLFSEEEYNISSFYDIYYVVNKK